MSNTILIKGNETGITDQSRLLYKELGFDFKNGNLYIGDSNNRPLLISKGEGDTTVPQHYGAIGDGIADDTSAFQRALEVNRVVHVPGGTYKLSGELIIGDNCCLELSQDTVLQFTQTSGNCITLGMSSALKGNHATVKVLYEFSGHVLHAYSSDHTSAEQLTVPPWTKWDPQWKSGRYVSDLNICKADSRGFHYLVNEGECKGTAVYISANGISGALSYMWGNHYSGLRIAGAFAYGIHAQNFNKGWLHEMRIDAFIDACEVGVCLEDCNQTYVSAIIQPRRGYNKSNVYFPYAKNGIKLIRSKNTDLSGSRVWDWTTPDDPSTTENEKTTLYEIGNEYQHIAMYGNCHGTILNDYTYHDYGDTRERIYTDDTSNLETLTILQEPITRWFKPIDGVPYFSDGYTEKKMMTQDDIDVYFDTDTVKNFTDVLSTATDTDGVTIFNNIGYLRGARFANWGKESTLTGSAYYMTTGFIEAPQGAVVNCKELKFTDKGSSTSYSCIAFYNANREWVANINIGNIVENKAPSYTQNYIETDDGCSFQIAAGATLGNLNYKYLRICFPADDVGTNPMMAINQEIKYAVEGFLADNIFVKEEYITGLEEKYVQENQKTTSISDSSTDEQYPSAKAVYTLLQEALGEYVDDVAKIIGGNA